MIRNLLTRIFTLSIILITSNVLYGQISVSNPDNSYLYPEDYKQLKKSTLYFVSPDFLMEDEEELQNKLSEAWTYCDIKVIGYKEFDAYKTKENSSFLNINISGFVQSIHYDLWMNGKPNSKRKNTERAYFASIFLDYNCAFDSFVLFNRFNPDLVILKYLYTKSEIINLKIGILCNNLKAIQSELNKQATVYESTDKTYKNSEQLKILKDETLYITENIKYKYYSKTTLRTFNCKVDKIDIDKVMTEYPYPYEFISFEELNEKILNGDEFNYLIYTHYNLAQNILSIFSSRGKLLYADLNKDPYCKPKDLSKITKLIK